MHRRETTGILMLGGLVAVAVAIPIVSSDIYWTSVLTRILIDVLLAVSLRAIFLVGEFSLGHVGFMCLGAYTSALLALKVGLPVGLSLLAGGVLAGLVALVLGYPFMRVKGIYFVILTVMASESIRSLAENWEGLTGGIKGLAGIPSAGVLSIPGIGELDLGSFSGYYYLTLGVVIISLFILYRLEKSRMGFTWIAIRESDKQAGAVGINVLRYKVVNFSIACFFAGIAGALLAHSEQTISAQPGSTFGVMTTMYLLIYMVVGGKSRFSGPILGAIALSLIVEFTRPMREYQPMLIGFIAIVIVMFIPEGLVSIPQKIVSWRSKIEE